MAVSGTQHLANLFSTRQYQSVAQVRLDPEEEGALAPVSPHRVILFS
jgi:hypothetical protein